MDLPPNAAELGHIVVVPVSHSAAFAPLTKKWPAKALLPMVVPVGFSVLWIADVAVAAEFDPLKAAVVLR